MDKTKKIKVGDSVVVKDRVKCSDMESFSIAGWQGRVSEIFDDEEDIIDGEIIICIELDSITLKSLPIDYIDKSEIEGLDWTTMCLAISDVELTKPRDTEDDVDEAIDEIVKTYEALNHEKELRVKKILENVDFDDEHACFTEWAKYLKRMLVFPFDAEIIYSDKSFLKVGDQVQVINIVGFNEYDGVIASIEFNGKKYTHPLSDLRFLEKDSPNYQYIKDYLYWFDFM